MTSRPLDDPRNRGRAYPGYTAQMHEGSPNHGLPKTAHSNAVTSRMPVSSGAPSMARMSQVIEDSIRGHMGEPTSDSPVRDQSNKQIPPGHVEKDLGGLACPRTKSPPTFGPALRTEEPRSSISQKSTRLNG